MGEDFRDFAFANITHLHGGMTPDFFKGSVVERETGAELARSSDARPVRQAVNA